MRVSPLRRSHLGIAAILSLVVTATLISAGTTAIPVEAQSAIEPQFLTWDGEPFADDLNHYLVRIDSVVDQNGAGWLRLDAADHLVAADPQDRVSVQDIEEAVAEPSHLDRGQVVEAVADHPAVTSMRAIGFDMYAVAGRQARQNSPPYPVSQKSSQIRASSQHLSTRTTRPNGLSRTTAMRLIRGRCAPTLILTHLRAGTVPGAPVSLLQ